MEKQLRGIELHLHVGELPLQALELAQQAAELPPLERPCARGLVRIAAERERARRVADALDIEAGDLLLEAAFAEQHLIVAHRRVREVELRPFLARHEARALSRAEPRSAALDQHRADAAAAGAGAPVDEDGKGISGV